MKRRGESAGQTVLLVLAAVVLFLAVAVIVFGLLGLLAAGLVSLIFMATEFDSGMSFGQLWLASSAAVALVGWIGQMFRGEKTVTIKKD